MTEQKAYNYDKITFLLSPSHRHALELMAQQDAESMSTILRGLILQEAKLRGLWRPAPLQKGP